MAYPEISHLQTYRVVKAEHKYCTEGQTTLRFNFKSWARYTHPYKVRTGYKVGHPLRFTPSLAVWKKTWARRNLSEPLRPEREHENDKNVCILLRFLYTVRGRGSGVGLA